MSKQETVNTFDGGLIMDLNPITTPNNVVTSCLNSTLITNNGNEFVLQNDMGNGRVETAKLDAGYIPVGIKEHGGIIYVASVNPLTNKCQLGSFPSPERNFTTDEISKSPIVLQTSDFFQQNLNTMYVRKELLDGEDDKLRPGDKFIIGSTGINDSLDNILSDYKTKEKRILRLHLAILDDDNNISYIEDEVNHVDGYWIYPLSGNEVDDAEILSGQNSKYPYNVYKNKVSGKLLLIAELETPKTFNTSVDVYKVEDEKVSMIVPISWDEDEEEKSKLLGVKVECEHAGEGALTRYVDFSKGNYEFKIEDLIKDDNLFTYAFTPYTSFGTIDYLSKRGSMNLSYIGTGKIDLVEWRYYIEDNSATISWGLEAYPRYGFQISEVKMTFIDVTDPNTQNIYRVRQRKSYNGNFTEYIVFDESNVYFDGEDMMLQKGKLYVVRIEVVSTNALDTTNQISNITYRLMYTSSTFNSYYIANKEVDFTSLKVDCSLDIDVAITSGDKKSNTKSLITDLVRKTGESTPEDMMSYIYTSFSEKHTIKAIPILKKPSDKNHFIGDIAEDDVSLNVDVDSRGVTVTGYEPRLSGADGMETYYQAIYPNVGSENIIEADNITLADLNKDDSMGFQTSGSSSNNTWTGTFRGSNIRKITSDLKVVRESGSIKRIAPYVDLANVSSSQIETLFGHEISAPISTDNHYHFNKMIFAISGRKKRSSSERLSGYATWSNGYWAMTGINWGKDQNYWGDLLADNTDFLRDFGNCLDSGYSGRPIFTVLRGCGKSEDGDGRLYITSNARVVKAGNDWSDSWPYWNTNEKTNPGWACPDGGGYDLNCNRWSFILWKTNDSNKYAAINACGFTNWRDMHNGNDVSLLDKLMILLSQLYVVQYKEFLTEKYVPNNIYYQNAFKTSYGYSVRASSAEKENPKELNIISNRVRITEDLVKKAIEGFDDVADERTIISELPSYNNVWYVLNLDETVIQDYSTTVSSPNADTLLTYYANAGQDNFNGLMAEDPEGQLYISTLSGEPFSESKIYWKQRGDKPGFYSVQEKPFTLYRDSFSSSGGKITVTRTNTVELDSGHYTNFANMLALETTSSGKPNILLNRAALSTAGTTKRQSRENSDAWFNIYNIKVSRNFAICQ